MSDEQIVNYFVDIFNFAIDPIHLKYFYIEQSANVVAPLINNIARLIVYILVLIFIKPAIFKVLDKKVIPSLENKVHNLIKLDRINKISEKTRKGLNIGSKALRGFFNAFILMLPIGVLLSSFQQLTFEREFEITITSSNVFFEVSNLNALDNDVEVTLDSGFINFVNNTNEFNRVNIHNWFSFISYPIFDWIFEEEMNEKYSFNIRKEFSNTAIIFQNLYQAGVFDKTFSLEELDSKDITLIADSIVVLSESELVLEVIESSIVVLEGGLLDEITNQNNRESDYTVESFQILNQINWEQELILVSETVYNFNSFNSFDALEIAITDPMHFFELNDNDIKIITESLRDLSSLELLKASNLLIDYMISSNIAANALTWLEKDDVKMYLEKQFESVLNDPEYFYGNNGEIHKITDLVDLIFLGNGRTKFKEYIDEEFSLDILLTYKTNLYVDELLDSLFNIKTVNPIISILVDDYIFQNFESDDAEEILERLEINFNNYSIQNEIQTIDDVFMALITINIPGYLESDQEVIDIVDEIITDHSEDLKDISFGLFNDSQAIQGLVNSLTPEAIYHFISDEELARLLVNSFFTEGRLNIDLAEEITLLIEASEKINELNSISSIQNLDDEELISFLEGFITNDLTKYKEITTILLDESKIVSNLLEISPNMTMDFFITDETTRNLIKKAYIENEQLRIDIDLELNHLIDNIVSLHQIISISDLETLFNEANYIEFTNELFVNHIEELETIVYEIFEKNKLVKYLFENAPEEFINIAISDEKIKNYLLDFFSTNDQQVVISEKIIETIEAVSILYSFTNIDEINESIEERSFNVYIKEKLTENKKEFLDILTVFELVSDTKDVEILIDLYNESQTYNQFFVSLVGENKDIFINVAKEVLDSDLIKNAIDNSAESLFDLFIEDEELKSLLIGAFTSEGKLNFELIDEIENIVYLLSDINDLVPLDQLLSNRIVNLNNTSNVNTFNQVIDIDFLLNNREDIENILNQFFELNTIDGMLRFAPEELIEALAPDEKLESLLKATLLDDDRNLSINLLDNILDTIETIVEINQLVPFNNFQSYLSFDLINNEYQTINSLLDKVLSNDLLVNLLNNATYEFIDYVVNDTKLKTLLFEIFLDEGNTLDVDISSEIYELLDILKFTNETIPIDKLVNDLSRSDQIIPILELLTNDYKTITKMVINRVFDLNIVQKTINVAFDEFLETTVLNDNIRSILNDTYNVTNNKADLIEQDFLYILDILELVNETLGFDFFRNSSIDSIETLDIISGLLYENKALTKFFIRNLFDTHLVNEIVDNHLDVLIDEFVDDKTTNDALKILFVENSSAESIEDDILSIIDIVEFISSALTSSQDTNKYYNNPVNQILYLIASKESALKTSINALFQTNLVKQALRLDFNAIMTAFEFEDELVNFIVDVFYSEGSLINIQVNLLQLIDAAQYYNEYLIEIVASNDIALLLNNFENIHEFVMGLENIQIINNIVFSDLKFVLSNIELDSDIISLIQLLLTEDHKLALDLFSEFNHINQILKISKKAIDFDYFLNSINNLNLEQLINLGYAFGSLAPEDFAALVTAVKDLQLVGALNQENTESLLAFLGVENVYVPATFDAGLELEYVLNLVYGLSVYLHEHMEPGLTPIEDVDFTELLLSDALAGLLLVQEGTLNSQLIVPNLAYSIETALIEAGLNETIIVPEVLLASSPESAAWVAEYNVLVTLLLTVAELASNYYELSFAGYETLVEDFKYKSSNQEEFVEMLRYIDDLVVTNLDNVRLLVSEKASNSQILVATADQTLNNLVEPILGTTLNIDVIQEIMTLLDVVEIGYGVFTIETIYEEIENSEDIFESLANLGKIFGSLEQNSYEQLYNSLINLEVVQSLNIDHIDNLFDFIKVDLYTTEDIDILVEIKNSLDLIYLTSIYLKDNYSNNEINLNKLNFSELLVSSDVYDILITDSQTPTLLSINFSYHFNSVLEYNEIDFLDTPESLNSANYSSEIWTNEYTAWIEIIIFLFDEDHANYEFSNEGLSLFLEEILLYELGWVNYVRNKQDESSKEIFDTLIEASLIID